MDRVEQIEVLLVVVVEQLEVLLVVGVMQVVDVFVFLAVDAVVGPAEQVDRQVRALVGDALQVDEHVLELDAVDDVALVVRHAVDVAAS